MKPKYDPMVHALILLGEILPDPESWSDDWFWSVAHCQDLLARIGVEDYNIIGDDEIQIARGKVVFDHVSRRRALKP